MRDHELELIASLAEGRLEDESEARDLLASSSEARAEFEAQKTALEALSTARPTSLSDTERSALHRDVWTELRTPATTSKTGTPWYYRWVPVAAGLFVVVGLVAVLSQGGAGDEANVSADMGAADTTLASSEATVTMAESPGEDDAAEGGETAPTSRTEEAADGDLRQALSPAAIAFYRAAAEDIRSGAETDSLETYDEASTPAERQECVRESGLEGYELHSSYPAPSQTDDGDTEIPEGAVPYIAAVPSGADLATAPIAFIDLLTCEVIHIDR